MKHLKSKILNFIFLCLILSFSAQAQAEAIFTVTGSPTGSANDIVAAIKALQTAVINAISSAWDQYLSMWQPSDPAMAAAQQVNSALPSTNVSTNPAIRKQLDQLSLTQIQQSLIQKDFKTAQTILASLPASDTYSEKNTDFSQGNNYMYPESLLGTVAFTQSSGTSSSGSENTSDDQNKALKYIDFATGIGQALSGINWSDLTNDQKKKMESSDAGRDYKIYLRSLVASRAMAVDNLYQMYMQRVPAQGLGTQAGMPNNKKDASPLEVQEYFATRRINDPNWYKTMDTAVPIVVLRESLYISAEMENQLYQLHRDNERIIAALSVLQLQNVQMAKFGQQQKEQQLRQAIGIAPSANEIQSKSSASAPGGAPNLPTDADIEKASQNKNTPTSQSLTPGAAPTSAPASISQ